MRTKLNIFYLSLTLITVLLINACERKTNPANPNQTPKTTIANIPKDNDTTRLFALLTLHWDGEDNDGYISGYEYRYTTVRLAVGDTIVQDWKFTPETSLTIPFLSDDSVNNLQIFEVRSIDDQGARDPNPAKKTFYTYRTAFPTTQILYPRNNKTYFAVEKITDWWPGIELSYKGHDPDQDKGGGITEYGWSVDGKDTVWTKDTVVVLKPEIFNPPLEGEHIIRVTSRDNTNLVDPKGALIKIKLIAPSLDNNNILIIDATKESEILGRNPKPTDAEVDQFYAEIFPGAVQWDYYQKGFPPVDELGKYKVVVWHSEDFPATNPHRIVNHTEELKDYMNVGGNIVLSGFRIIKSFAWLDEFPVSFESDNFVNEYLHIVSVDETPGLGDFIGAEGLKGVYSNFSIDAAKLSAFPWFGKLGYIAVYQLPAGFTDGIYFYKNEDNSPYFKYRGRTCGLRYYGTSFQSVVLGFPLWYVKQDDAKIMAKEILTQMGINL